MSRISPKDWRPKGIKDLESNAWEALKNEGSVCLVAGPGTGKTEFLAQKAAFLLETSTCPWPYKVLALSFKKDAALNLAERVRERCPPELSSRFFSFTFDAFIKSFADRFLEAIPQDWRPTRSYTIDFAKSQDVDIFLRDTRPKAPQDWQEEIEGIKPQDFEARHVGNKRLPQKRIEPQSGIDYAIDCWWNERLRGQSFSQLTFTSLNRLTELLLRTHPQIRRALRATYPFVFIDEFQDTTDAQYDFLLSAFAEYGTILTAVGDPKQSIMSWAGAKENSFQEFEKDFKAIPIELNSNFRSSPALVHLQRVVASALDPNTNSTVSQTTGQIDGDAAQIWRSTSEAEESQYLAKWLKQDMDCREKTPRDYVLLVRQKPEDFERVLKEPLAQFNLRLRNENRNLGKTTLQDLLVDKLSCISLALLRLGTVRREPKSWRFVMSALQKLNAIDPEDEVAYLSIEAKLENFLNELHTLMATLTLSRDHVSDLVEKVFNFLDLSLVARSYSEYSTADFLSIMSEAFKSYVMDCTAHASNWPECLDTFEGLSLIPLMTVHKSKGREYDTVIFVGLEDQAWWSYVDNNKEGKATFFVALSRAKQRVIFTYCQKRGGFQKIADLYQLLQQAGVQEIDLSTEKQPKS